MSGEAAAARPARRLGAFELTAFLALSMALAALGIDLMLPALGNIREDLDLAPDSTAVSGLITTYFMGLAFGQLVYGPFADRFGRRAMLYVGYGIYAAGALASTVAPSLPVMLVSRFIWGLGSAGPRVITLAVIRDTYEGDRMARAMSFVLAVFILVPVIAPSIGALTVAFVSWRWLFGGCVIAVGAVALWATRLPETLPDEHRLELRLGRVLRATREVVTHRQTALYTLAVTAMYGGFTAYIGSSEIILDETFGVPGAFPFVFGGLAACMGIAMLGNARLVGRVGARRLAHRVLGAYVAIAGLQVVVALATGGRPPLWLFLVGMVPLLSSHALIVPNFNSIALEPMGHIAGIASSVIGAVQLSVGALLGSFLDGAFDGTVRPLAIGYLAYGLAALVLIAAARRASPVLGTRGPVVSSS